MDGALTGALLILTCGEADRLSTVSTLAERVAALSPAERELFNKATYQDLHPIVVSQNAVTILDFFDSIPWLKSTKNWLPWRAFLAALYGLPMTPAELAIYRKCTGRQDPPTERATEGWLICGRRARKSAVTAVIAAYEAAYRDHSKYTAPGELPVIPILGRNKAEAQQIRRYVSAIFEAKSLSWMVQDAKDESIRIKPLPDHPGIEIMVKAATLMAGRSRATPLAALDEVAFFRSDESANPDVEIVRSITPGMATVPDPLLMGLSSPYARRGLLWSKYKEHYGREGSRVLVWQADTLTMHPGNEQIAAHVANEYASDPVSADAEYGANFRKDVEQFVPEEIVDAVTVKGRKVVERIPGVQHVAFCDPSGGTSDSFTLGIAHWVPAVGSRPDYVVMDLLEERHAPFEPSEIVMEFAGMLKAYGVKTVEGDHYAGEWPREQFRKHGIGYLPSDYAKREIYKNTLPLLTSERVELLDVPRLKVQLTGLDRRSGTGGDIIDHAKGAHDDVANAACGALFRASRLRLPAKPLDLPPPRTTHEILRRQIMEGQKREREGPPKSPNPWRRQKR